MTHYYSDPSREKEKYALPDVEVFYADVRAVCERNLDVEIIVDEYGHTMTGGAFLKMLRANCPIEYRYIGTSFS